MFDVGIVGCGVIGASVARELARADLRIAVFERGDDAAVGASKANSGIVHAGYDAKPGTLKAKYNVAGNSLFEELSAELDFPFRRCGSLILSLSSESDARLAELKRRGETNGVRGLEIIDKNKLASLEPNISPNVSAALFAPSGGIVCPYEMTIAHAENAAANGAVFFLNCNVDAITKQEKSFLLGTSRGDFACKILINAAGLHADDINNMLSAEKIAILPRRGEYCILDRSEGGLANRTLFQLPDERGKGVLVTPTVDGNIMLGPTSELIADKEGDETTAKGMASVLERAGLDVKRLPADKIIASFAGLRAHPAGDDFIVGPSPDVRGLINLAGMESPGLTSAPAIAREIAGLVADMTRAGVNPRFNPIRRAAPRFRHLSGEERRALIKTDPDYGHIVCRCENVTRAEIVAALRSPLGVSSLDAVKRRTRAGMGRCQGGFCRMRLPEIIAEEKRIPWTEISKTGGDRLFVGKNKAIP